MIGPKLSKLGLFEFHRAANSSSSAGKPRSAPFRTCRDYPGLGRRDRTLTGIGLRDVGAPPGLGGHARGPDRRQI